MSPDTLVNFGRDAIMLTLTLSMPMLGLGLVVGLSVSIFQAVTSIQEITLTFIPKIMAIMLALVIFSPWMLEKLVTYTRALIINIPNYVR